MSLRSLFDKSRDALYALAAVERVEDVGAGINMVGEQHFGPAASAGGFTGLLGGNDLRNVLFWTAIVVVLLLLAALSNPNENSFRSHLTELSFRRHLVDIRASDSLASSSDHADASGELASHAHPVTVTSGSHSSSMSAPTPFRFANHVAINLRTPPMLYRSHWFFSTGIATPLVTPTILTLSDPMSVLKRGRERDRERSTVFIGFFGHWSPVTVNLLAELLVTVLGDGREKGKRRERPGILDVKALSAKEDLPTSKPLPLAPKLLKAEPIAEPLVPPSPSPSLSRRPSLGSGADVPDSPLVVSLKADLTAAQSTLSDLKAQLHVHESSTDSALTLTLDDLRNRRKEDDAERQELKSKTKSLEEQKRQAESARREAEKKLRAVESLRDGLESKIAAARHEAKETRENMDQSERNVRSIQEEGARHVVETLDNVESKREELGRLEAELVDLESRNDELGKLVKEAEDRLQVVTESGARASPEEEMMMMAAAYEAAAQEGYMHHSQNQWAHQAAAYMAEAGMPYLGQDYTARPTRTTSGANHHADFSGFDDFGPTARDRLDRDYQPPQPSALTHRAQPARTLDISKHPSEAEDEEEVEIGPGSPNGTSFLPQGLFRSLEGDATPLDLGGHESGSDSGDELWRSPVSTEHPTVADHTMRLPPPSSTTPPVGPGNASGGAPAPALPGLPALPGSRRWFSAGTSSAENVSSFSFMHPMGTTSNDSLNFDPSPFAPSASEKKALKWGPLSKYRWARGNDAGAGGAGGAPASGPSARSSSVDLGNGIVPTSVSGGTGNHSNNRTTSTSSGSWLSSRFGSSTSTSSGTASASDARAQAAFSAFTNSGLGNGIGGVTRQVSSPVTTGGASGQLGQGHGQGQARGEGGGEGEEAHDEVGINEEDDEKAEKRSFRFFSLRKTPSSTS